METISVATNPSAALPEVVATWELEPSLPTLIS
jgi:hypothetical protein